jgi:hypothetical protein
MAVPLIPAFSRGEKENCCRVCEYTRDWIGTTIIHQ